MESRHHGYRPFNPSHAKPFLAWMNSSHREAEQGPNCAASMGPSRVLLQELLWQFEQRECLALEEERQRCSHGALGYRRPLTRDSLLALIPASECRLLERLCARIPPSHTATVLFRFREILAHNYVVPWELVCIFKQVLRDFLKRQEEVGYRKSFPPAPPMLLPVSPPPADINTRDQKTTKSSSLEGKEKHREEIPTISSYVDRHLHSACSHTVQRHCLPYCRSFPYD
ncbi:protein RD3-like [Pangasianodon hypophthalmus]|uniref:protein RD3-like n=1 Tax=Pangasianodon hypophthalmus TaxID=310915 RepID=UPI000F009ADD|nr:protein RD3-like [Pangasianodon hypophthalmus]